jgi:hypothetical protein
MGSPISQVASSTQPQGKGFASPAQQPVRIDGLDQNAINADPQGFQQWQEMSRSTQGNPSSQMMSPAVQPEQTRQGKGGSVTLPGQGGQPRMGQPNMYPNTVGQWDNASIQPQQSRNRGGKGKG